MYKTSAELKNDAKKSLQGQWGKAAWMFFIPNIIPIIFIILFIVPLALFALYYTTNGYYDTSVVNNYSSYGYNFDLFDLLSDSTSYWGGGGLVGSFFAVLFMGRMFSMLYCIRDSRYTINPIKDLFSAMNRYDFFSLYITNLLTHIFTALWTLLFFIPGIVKGYSYSQAFFIYRDMADNDLTEGKKVTDYITESRVLMNGHKGRLFWLDISFIGWYFVVGITFGIAGIWVTPYIAATKAAFYDDLAKDRYIDNDVYKENSIDNESWDDF